MKLNKKEVKMTLDYIFISWCLLAQVDMDIRERSIESGLESTLKDYLNNLRSTNDAETEQRSLHFNKKNATKFIVGTMRLK